MYTNKTANNDEKYKINKYFYDITCKDKLISLPKGVANQSYSSNGTNLVLKFCFLENLHKKYIFFKIQVGTYLNCVEKKGLSV